MTDEAELALADALNDVRVTGTRSDLLMREWGGYIPRRGVGFDIDPSLSVRAVGHGYILNGFCDVKWMDGVMRRRVAIVERIDAEYSAFAFGLDGFSLVVDFLPDLPPAYAHPDRGDFIIGLDAVSDYRRYRNFAPGQLAGSLDDQRETLRAAAARPTREWKP